MAGLGKTALETAFPAGTDVYVALYSTEVDIVSESGTELTDSTYARVAFDDWKTVVGVHEIWRTNAKAIVFPALSEGEKSVRWWAIWDADMGGNLLAAGPLQTSGEPTEVAVSAGDQFRFNTEALRLRVVEGV